MDTRAVARLVVAEAAPDLPDDWRHAAGILKSSARLDIPLRDPQETLHVLRYLANELPAICLRIEAEKTKLDRQIVAQDRLSLLRKRIMRRKG